MKILIHVKENCHITITNRFCNLASSVNHINKPSKNQGTVDTILHNDGLRKLNLKSNDKFFQLY